jgi:SpoVK/Ycf46/Vps4 family AAA+-type ATPase
MQITSHHVNPCTGEIVCKISTFVQHSQAQRVCTSAQQAHAGVFAAARAAAPAVVFMDEIDAVAPSRSDPGNPGNGAAGPAGDMSLRMVATLLMEMDGV